MKLILEPSLKRFTCIKIAHVLWNQDDIKDSMSKYYSRFSDSELRQPVSEYIVRKVEWRTVEDRVLKEVAWQEIEDRVIEKVTELPLPELIREKLEGYIRPVGLQILKLMVYDCEGPFLVNLPFDIQWKSQGIIDRKKTVEKIIENENVDIVLRFELACIFCLEKNIFQLWNKMSADIRDSLSYTGVNIYSLWRSHLTRKASNFHHTFGEYQCLFITNAGDGIIAAAEYFFAKLDPIKKEYSLLEAALIVKHADVLWFLLSQMNQDQQIKIFKHDTYKVLRCFLYWPFQSLFIEAADHMWSFLSKKSYSRLLLDIILKIELDYKDYNYKELFEEFWLKSPIAFKRYILKDGDNYWPILRKLLLAKEKENFKLIIMIMFIMKKKDFIGWDVMENICKYLFFESDWGLLEFIIQKCLPSKIEMKKFKSKFESEPCIKSFLRLSENKEKWDQLFPLHRKSISRNTKQKCVANKKDVKRLCRVRK